MIEENGTKVNDEEGYDIEFNNEDGDELIENENLTSKELGDKHKRCKHVIAGKNMHEIFKLTKEMITLVVMMLLQLKKQK